MNTPEANRDPSDTSDKPSPIDAALVDRVAECLAMGIPLKIALAGEPVTRAEYKDYLLLHPELQARQDIAIKNFLKNAINMVFEGENRGANIRWLIELVYPGVLGSEEAQSAKPKQTSLGLPDDIIQQIRENAKRL